MKYGMFASMLAAFVLMSPALPAAAGEAGLENCGSFVAAAPGQGQKPASGTKINLPKEQTEYPVSSIKMGTKGGRISPGDDLQIVFSVAGPPDQILPMRSKSKDEKDDYIHFIYRNRFTININKQNMVQSIVVLGNNIDLEGIPFKIGQKTSDVTAKWKQPERETGGMLIYYFRGVYIITSKEAPGKIDRIYITKPGKVDNDNNSTMG